MAARSEPSTASRWDLPAAVKTSPPPQVRQASGADGLRAASLSREESTAIARLTAALDERTLELERVRRELGAAQQHRLDLAVTGSDRETLLDKLKHAADDQARAEQSLALARTQHAAELETVEAQLAGVNRENTEHTTRIHELEQQLSNTRTQHAELSKTIPAQRELERTLQQHKAQLAALETQLAQANRENTEHTTRIHELEQQLSNTRTQHAELSKTIPAQRELERTLQQHKAQLAALETQLARADEERARFAALAHEREAELEQSRAQASHERQEPADRAKALEHRHVQSHPIDEPAAGHHSLRDLELIMKQHKAELEAVGVQLAQALQDRTHQASRASDLEQQLRRASLEFDDPAGEPPDEAAQRELVAEARARAQRRYGPPLRTTDGGEVGQKADELVGPTRAPTPAGRSHTIRIWHLALIAGLVLLALSALVARSVLAGASIAALVGVIVIAAAWSRRSRGSSYSPHLPVDTTSAEPPA